MTQAEDANLQFSFFIGLRTIAGTNRSLAGVQPWGAGRTQLSRLRDRTAPADIRIQRRSLRHQGRKAGFCLPTKDGGREAALRNRTGGPAADDAGGPVGDLALGGGRKDPQLHDRRPQG